MACLKNNALKSSYRTRDVVLLSYRIAYMLGQHQIIFRALLIAAWLLCRVALTCLPILGHAACLDGLHCALVRLPVHACIIAIVSAAQDGQARPQACRVWVTTRSSLSLPQLLAVKQTMHAVSLFLR